MLDHDAEHAPGADDPSTSARKIRRITQLTPYIFQYRVLVGSRPKRHGPKQTTALRELLELSYQLMGLLNLLLRLSYRLHEGPHPRSYKRNDFP